MRKLAWPLPTTPEPETTFTLDRQWEYSTTRTKCFSYPPSPPKPVKLLTKYLIEQYGQTTKPLSQGWDLIQAVTDVEKWKQWSICCVSVCTIPSCLGLAWWCNHKIPQSGLQHIRSQGRHHLNVIYNVPHPSLLMYIPDKLTRNTFLILTQKMKRDIIYRRMNLPPLTMQFTSTQRLMAHLDSAFWRLHSYLSYTGLAKFKKSIIALQVLQEVNLNLP